MIYKSKKLQLSRLKQLYNTLQLSKMQKNTISKDNNLLAKYRTKTRSGLSYYPKKPPY